MAVNRFKVIKKDLLGKNRIPNMGILLVITLTEKITARLQTQKHTEENMISRLNPPGYSI